MSEPKDLGPAETIVIEQIDAILPKIKELPNEVTTTPLCRVHGDALSILLISQKVLLERTAVPQPPVHTGVLAALSAISGAVAAGAVAGGVAAWNWLKAT